MVVLALSSFAAALSETFTSLMGARVIGALAQGAFWAMISSVGAQIVPPHRVGLATSIIFGGVSAASVLGVPLANLIGNSENWRVAFACASALSFAVAAVSFVTLPKLPGLEGVGMAAMGRVLSNRRFQRIFTATVLTITAHFMAFTYVEPFLGAQSSVAPSAIAPLLFAFGGAGLAANVLTGSLIDRSLKSVLMAALCLASGALLILSTLSNELGTLGTTLMLVPWGAQSPRFWWDSRPGSSRKRVPMPCRLRRSTWRYSTASSDWVLYWVHSCCRSPGSHRFFLVAAAATALGMIAIVLLSAPAAVPVSVK
nr:MFS transporter [Marinobacterium rhizophilum]